MDVFLIKFNRSSVSVFINGKKEKGFTVSEKTYPKLFEFLAQKMDFENEVEYQVSQYNELKFSTNSFGELSEYLSRFCDA